MAKYSIKDLENFTKIKAHTLRIWEQRYELLKPERTETNIRYYSDRDVKKIMNINLLYNNGYKISKIAKLTEKELFEIAAGILTLSEGNEEDEINGFVENIIALNEGAIVEALQRISAKIGFERMYPEVLIPLLEKVGTLWQVDAISVSHEHFMSNLLREFFISEITKLPASIKAKGKVVLFLPEHEKHELSLLYYYYLLKKRKYDCFYLGQSVPLKDLKTFINQVEPDFVFSSLISELTTASFDDLFKSYAEMLQLTKFYIGGVQMLKHENKLSKQVNKIQGIEDFAQF